MPEDKNANIFRDLATLIEAGISVLDAAKKVALHHPKISAWPEVIKALASGQTLNKALATNGLISAYEKEIISLSEFSGRLPQGLQTIASAYDIRRKRVSKLKSKLYLPIAILVVAIIVSAILSLAAPSTTGVKVSNFNILLASTFWLALIYLFTQKLMNIISKDSCDWLKTFQLFSRNDWYVAQFQQVVFGALLWQVKSGVDFKMGFIRVSKLLGVSALTKKLKQASRYCEQGLSVTQSSIKSKLPISDEFKQILLTAEQSGQWEYSLEKYQQQQSILLEIKTSSIFDWMPKIYYVFATLTAISVIF